MKRSAAASRLEQKETEDEIREALTPAVREDIALALAGARVEATPASEDEILVEVTLFVAGVGQDWTKAGREEFIDRVTDECMDLPGEMLLDALRRARRRVWDGRRLLVWIFEDVAEGVAKLKTEIAALERLTELAESDGR